jgi:hypothetical protein
MVSSNTEYKMLCCLCRAPLYYYYHLLFYTIIYFIIIIIIITIHYYSSKKFKKIIWLLISWSDSDTFNYNYVLISKTPP